LQAKLSYPSAIIFDCDGVLLDSNMLKNECFREAVSTLGFSQDVANRFAELQRRNFGVSRYRIFERLYTDILQIPVDTQKCAALIAAYAELCAKRYSQAPLTDGAVEILHAMAQRVPLFVASGSDQTELRQIFTDRALDHWFINIFGSPSPKAELLCNIRDKLHGVAPREILMIGDAAADYESAAAAGLSFAFVSRYSASPQDIHILSTRHVLPVFTDLNELYKALVESSPREIIS
jgi:phosphoglycolate phosphatase-like HAD superfamily hydrolase